MSDTHPRKLLVALLMSGVWVNRQLDIRQATAIAATIVRAGWLSPKQVEQAKAEAYDEGEADGRHNEHEFRPGKQMTNPYKEAKA